MSSSDVLTPSAAVAIPDSDLAPRARYGYVDNLKVLLVVGVILGHTTMAWTGMGNWVFEEPRIREPFLSIASLFVIGAMFGMALLFAVAGMFTPPSLARKGTRRYLLDRALRLGVPMLFYILAFSPFIEYVDPSNEGWSQGFGAFVLEILWPPAPGPTWFLGVLLLFSVGYALVRIVRPGPPTRSSSPPVWGLVIAAGVVAFASYAIRIAAPLGVEVWRLSVGQAPGWVVGFTLGVLGAEKGWFAPIAPRIARVARRAALTAIVMAAMVLGAVGALGMDIDPFGGGGTWQSLVLTMLEGILVVAAPLWLLDLFRRRYGHRGRLAVLMGRSAFAAFVMHQLVLVGLVLASRLIPWPPEVEYLLVSGLGVAISFSLGALLVRVPGVNRFV
jgi:glucan biosynthesis protein C